MGGEERRNKQTRGVGRDSTFPRLLGDRLCLDFANTVEGPASDHPEEFLRGFADVARWGYHVGLLDDGEVERIVADGSDRPEAAERAFAAAVALRDALDRLFRAVARGEPPEAADLGLLHDEYAAALGKSRLAPEGDRFAWVWPGEADGLDAVLWPVARSAVEVLTAGEMARVKECPGAGDCGWLFYDESKNGTRRWCSMEGCGSRVKMRRLYARARRKGA